MFAIFTSSRRGLQATLATLGLSVALAPTLLIADEFKLINLTVSGASPGGLWSAFGVGLDRVVKTSYPDATVTYQTSSGGLANARLVADDKVHLGIVSDMELMTAWQGTGVFLDRPQKNLRVLFRLFNPDSRFQALHVILNRNYAIEHGIQTFADIGLKKPSIRIAVNRPGNLDGDTGIAILEAAGLPLNQIEAWGGRTLRAATREQAGLMADRRLDMIVFGIAYNHSSVQEMSNAVPLMMLDVTEQVAAEVTAVMGGRPCVIKRNEYTFLDHDATTVCTGAVLIASSSMDDEIAYALTKTMLDNLEIYKETHPQLARVTTLQTVAEASVAPRHPGAERALREAGLIN